MRTNVTTIHYERGVQWKRLMNAVGAIVTFIVFIILMVTKFTEGAWVVVLAIPLLVYMFRYVNDHYAAVAKTLSTREFTMGEMRDIADVVIVPIADVHKGTLRALRFARRLSNNVRAVCISTSEEMKANVQRRWERFPDVTGDLELIFIDYEYRDILTPLVDYIIQVNSQEFPTQLTPVVIPEFVPETWTGRMLHNQTANFLRFRLLHYEDIVIIDVPYHVHE